MPAIIMPQTTAPPGMFPKRRWLARLGHLSKCSLPRDRDLEHDPEKWAPVFRKDHAQTKRLNNNIQGRDSMKRFYLSAAVLAASVALPALPALAQTNEITIGITLTTTGPGAALGIPERNALDFVTKEIAGVPLQVIVLDDGGDPTTAT